MLSKASVDGLRRFLKHAETLKPQNNPQRENGFAKEFQEIKEVSSKRKKDPNFSTHHGEKDKNRPKNRYKDIMPYDNSRIILPRIGGVQESDYINGNYIKGPSDEVQYLAVQGPLPLTVNDFWRMIISHQTQVIVMACREYELGKLKCKRYWPEKNDEILKFDACDVSLISQEEMGDGFVIRTLSAKHPNGELKITQFHYTAWPDHDVPRSATPLIELTMSFRAFVGNDNKVPVVVHCSAGCGRTGTICALDYALNLIKIGKTDSFSVFDIVSNLRRQRIAMVQTKEQYELVYKAVKEIVSNELLKQRSSMHTYVNVSVGEEPPENENMYENVDFMRSIQRLHEEEKNAARKPKEPPTKSTAKKGVVLAPHKNNVPHVSPPKSQEKSPPIQNKGKPLPNQKPEENVTPTSKPPIKKKPQSGYENVLPLSTPKAVSKPPPAPKPQNYVNVAIATQDKPSDDYVNMPIPVPVPVPEKNEHRKPKVAANDAKSSSPVPERLGNRQPKEKDERAKPLKHAKQDLDDKENDDYVVPQALKKNKNTPDYVIPPTIPGNVVDLTDPGPKSRDREVQSSKSVDDLLLVDLSQPSSVKPPQGPDHSSQSKPTGRLPVPGQYSLVGAFDSSTPSDTSMTTNQLLSALEPAQPVIEPVKPDKPVATPRRASAAFVKLPERIENTPHDPPEIPLHPHPQGRPVGLYSMVDPPKARNEKKTELLINFSEGDFNDVSRVKKSHSTDNILSGKFDLYSSVQKPRKKLSKQPSLDSNLLDYSQISSEPLSRGRSEDVLSTIKTSPQGGSVSRLSGEEEKESRDVLGNGLPKKRQLGVRRSNSNVTASSVDFGVRDEVESLYATVGAKTKEKRRPMAAEIFANEISTPETRKQMNRSNDSSSSLRSITSTSSTESNEDVPPIPMKTADALLYPEDDHAYEAVQKSSQKSTLNRLKSKAKHMIPSGAHVTKLSLGRKHDIATDSLSSGPGRDSFSSDKGFQTHVGKPRGPRPCPTHWPKFKK